MRRLIALAPLALLAACGQELTPEEQAAEDAAAIAAVEQANSRLPPLQPASPQVIGFPDMERHGIFGMSCAFVPEGGGLGALFLAMAEGGYLKLEGAVLELAPDPGSEELPYGARSRYDGTAHSVSLELAEEQAVITDSEAVNYPARLRVEDPHGRAVYEAQGLAQCGA